MGFCWNPLKTVGNLSGFNVKSYLSTIHCTVTKYSVRVEFGPDGLFLYTD